VFLDVYGRTFWIAGLVTMFTLLLGFPSPTFWRPSRRAGRTC
jgi:ABC-type spermidine/putrescine transport system permease subunit I